MPGERCFPWCTQRGQLLAQVDRQMALERQEDFLMLSNPVYSKSFRRAHQEVTGATLGGEGT